MSFCNSHGLESGKFQILPVAKIVPKISPTNTPKRNVKIIIITNVTVDIVIILVKMPPTLKVCQDQK